MLVGYALNTRKIISHKKGEASKARVNEWRSNKKNSSFKRYQRGSQCECLETFPKSVTAFLISPTFLLFYSYLDLFRL